MSIFESSSSVHVVIQVVVIVVVVVIIVVVVVAVVVHIQVWHKVDDGVGADQHEADIADCW